MSVPSRRSMRERLAALLTTAGNWQAAYNEQPQSFSGQSPVATVHGGSVTLPQETFGTDEDLVVELIVTNFVKRADPAAAEDSLDALLVALLDVVVANQKDASGNWDNLFIAGSTEPDYFLVDGKQYRGEVIRVMAEKYV